MNRDLFLSQEKIAYKLFSNCIKNDRLAPCYLLYGERRAPLLDTALFLAKSFSCQSKDLACDNCPSCKRFDLNVRPDFFLIDGDKELIKKEDVDELEKKFSSSSLESGHRGVYIINKIETITDKASNALLKFLEEPREGQIAILTTNNIDKVLKTILSRSITVRIDPLDNSLLIDELLNTQFEFKGKKGKKKEQDNRLSYDECFMLSRFFSSLKEIQDVFKEDDSFHIGFSLAEDFLMAIPVSFFKASYQIMLEASQKYDNKCYNWLYLILHDVFSTALLGDDIKDYPFKETIDILRKDEKKTRDVDDVLKDLLKKRNLNLNTALSSSRIASALLKED